MDWFRMYGEFASDPKVQSMSEAMQRRLIMLLCLRCSNTLVTLQDDEIAFALRIDDAELALTKALFLKKGFVDGSWEIMNWDKRQFVSDSSAGRVAKHRAKKKEAEKQPETKAEEVSNVTVTAQNRTDTEQNRVNNPIGLFVADDADDEQNEDGDCLPDFPLIDDELPLPAKENCPHQKILALYHQLLPASPAIKDWTPARADVLRVRWNENADRQDLNWWRRFFAYIAQSPFLTGQASSQGKRPFTPGLEWILKAENFAKIREGRYHQEAA
ncbi:MAG: hypothetical protein ACRYF5_15155 [Janthinobacterium lividum]